MQESGTYKSPLPLAAVRAAGPGVGAWRAAALALVIVATMLALWPTTETLLVRWTDTVTRSYTHGPLILVMAFIIAWRNRADYAAVAVAPSPFAMVLAAGLGVVWLVSVRAGISIAHQALLPLICISLAWSLFGFALTRRALLPLAFLYFAIPVWDTLVPALQWASTLAVRGVLSVIGIPVYFDGLEFQIPAGRFEIAGGCSGLHFFIVAIAIATFYGELHRDSARTRIKLIVYAALAALLTNWVRIAIIIMAGHLTDMQHYLVSGEHYSFGWIMFAVAMAIYLAIVRRWPGNPEPVAAPAQAGVAIPAGGVLLAAAALLLPAVPAWLDANVADEEAALAQALPPRIDGWQSRADAFAAPPRFANADDIRQFVFESRGESVQAFSAVYRQQLQGKELGGFENAPLGERFVPVDRPRVSDDWLGFEARDRAGRRWWVLLRYRVGERDFLDPRRAQIFYGLSSLWSDPVSSAIVLRAACEPDCEAARATLDRFSAQLARP